MPGSGKSTLGENLSKALGANFHDLDHLIEAKTGQPIKELFRQNGEEWFRQTERAALESYISSFAAGQMSLLALGGGTPCFFDNMELINQSGISVFLDTPLEVIRQRMMSDEEMIKRPLMAGVGAEGIAEELQRKYEQRVPFYSMAHLKIKGDESLTSISSLIKSLIDPSERKPDR